MTLTVLRVPCSANRTCALKDLGRHFPPVSPGEDDSMQTLDGTSEPGYQRGLSTLKRITSFKMRTDNANSSIPFILNRKLPGFLSGRNRRSCSDIWLCSKEKLIWSWWLLFLPMKTAPLLSFGTFSNTATDINDLQKRERLRCSIRVVWSCLKTHIQVISFVGICLNSPWNSTKLFYAKISVIRWMHSSWSVSH